MAGTQAPTGTALVSIAKARFVDSEKYVYHTSAKSPKGDGTEAFSTVVTYFDENNKPLYKTGPDGQPVLDSQGKKVPLTEERMLLGIDCSNMTTQVLQEGGYNVGYRSTGDLMDRKNGRLSSEGQKSFSDVSTSDIKVGDVVFFYNPNTGVGHMGIVSQYDASTGRGKFISSQSSTANQRGQSNLTF